MSKMASNIRQKLLSFLTVPSGFLTRLFWPRPHRNADIESQPSQASVISLRDNVRNHRPEKPAFDGPKSSQETHVSGDDEKLQKPSKVRANHRTIEITDEMVEKMQIIVDSTQELTHHQSQYDAIERNITQLEISRARVMDELAQAQNAGNEQSLQQDIDQVEGSLNELYQQRDALGPRLKIFRANVTFGQSDFQSLFQGIFTAKGLLNVPKPDVENVAIAGEATDGMANHEDPLPSQDRSTNPDIHDKLAESWKEFANAQELFDNTSAKYTADEAAYADCIANGEDDTPRSEFDRMFVRYRMAVTRNLIEAEKAYDDQLAKAEAQGLVMSDCDNPSEYGSSMGYSSPEDEIERAGVRDYSSVNSWMDGLPCSALAVSVATSNIVTELLEPETDVDDWECRTIDMSDSISIVA